MQKELKEKIYLEARIYMEQCKCGYNMGFMSWCEYQHLLDDDMIDDSNREEVKKYISSFIF